MSGTDLALASSATEIEEQLKEEAADRIADAAVQIGLEEIQTKIREHYEERARKLMEPIWKDCKKRTKHRLEKSEDYSEKSMTCTICHAPYRKTTDEYGSNNGTKFDKNRATEGFKKLGHQLREADREAGIEWIP